LELETIYRVLTFIALGVALLVVGFIYNKFPDTIRKWLLIHRSIALVMRLPNKSSVHNIAS
jgi:hypothetical protein